MASLCKITVVATAFICVAALAISIYPGWLDDLLFVAMLLGVFAVPIILIVLAIVAFTQYRRGNFRSERIPWKFVAAIFVMLFITYTALRLYVPRRIAFAFCRSTFQQIVDDGVADNHSFDRRIGPYDVDECLVDVCGGEYFRVYTGADGLGPDVMSYGFCHNPNGEGSPFGAAHYRTFRLGNDWYWFRASDDWD
jgi:hypothetical protein